MRIQPNDPNFIHDLSNLPPGGAHFYLLLDGKTFVLTKDLQIETRLGTITIPAGFKTDLASIPKRLRSIISVLGKHFVAAILHDFWYRVPVSRYKSVANLQDCYNVTRERADEIFLEEMADLKVSWWKRRLMYRAVRIGGASSWKE